MSLINDALVDLEQRKTAANLDARDSVGGASIIFDRRRRYPVFFVFIPVLALIVYWVSGRHDQENDSQPLVNNPSITRNQVSMTSVDNLSSVKSNDVPVANRTDYFEEDYSNKGLKDERPMLSVNVDNLNQEQKANKYLIERKVKKARRAIEQLRLTKPKAYSAYKYFTDVLELDPDNKSALDGINEIKQKYTHLYEQALIENDLVRSHSLLSSLRSMLLDGEIAQFEKHIGSIDDKYLTDTVSVQNTVSVQDIGSLANTSVVNIEKSVEQVQKEFLAGIDILIEKDELQLAQEKMELMLNRGAGYPLITDRLVDLYLKDNKLEKAIFLMDSKGTKHTRHAFLYAKAINEVQGEFAAMDFLESNSSQDIRAKAMLAGLMQKHERYKDAFNLYQSLVNIDRGNGIYWLGLALSLDKLNKVSGALDAYKRALKSNAHALNVERFINQRIEVLSVRDHPMELSQW